MVVVHHQRRRILDVARSLLGVQYDYSHTDTSWRTPRTKPRALDCSTFVCRVANQVLGLDLPASAVALIDQLAVIGSPQPGDLVAYWRHGDRDEQLAGYDIVWHVMLYFGSGEVIGACDIAGAVVRRPLGYEEALDRRRWQTTGIEPSPYRCLEQKPA